MPCFVDFIVSNPKHYGWMRFYATNVLYKLFSIVAHVIRITPWVHLASKHEVMHYHNAVLIAFLVEVLGFEITTSPDSNSVEVSSDHVVYELVMHLGSDSSRKRVWGNVVRSLDKDIMTIQTNGKRATIFVFVLYLPQLHFSDPEPSPDDIVLLHCLIIVIYQKLEIIQFGFPQPSRPPEFDIFKCECLFVRHYLSWSLY